MKFLFKHVMTIFGVIFGLLVLGFTGFQTWNLLYEVSHSPVVATLGLALFEGGMLYWWFVFQKSADGLPQMAISLLAALFGLIVVGIASSIHLGAFDISIIGQQTPARLVTIAAVVNLTAKFLMPLVSPEAMENIYQRAIEGMVIYRAYQRFQDKSEDRTEYLTGVLSQRWQDSLETRLLNGHNAHYLAAGKTEPVVIEHDNSAADTKPSPAPADDQPAIEPTPAPEPINQDNPLHLNGSS